MSFTVNLNSLGTSYTLPSPDENEGYDTLRYLRDSASAINSAGGQSVSSSLLNVKTYGAKGDGAHDDTTAIQAALNAAKALGGATVVFDAGTYIVSSTLTLFQNHCVKMQGPAELNAYTTRGAILKWTGAAGGTMLSVACSDGFAFTGIQLQGNSLAGYGAYLTSDGTGGPTRSFHLHDFAVYGMQATTGVGVYVGSSANNQVSEGTIERFVIDSPYGIRQEGSQTVNVKYSGASQIGNHIVGFDFVGGDVSMDHIDFQSVNPAAIADVRIGNTSLWARFTNNYHELTVGCGYKFVSGTGRNWFTEFSGVRMLAISTDPTFKLVDYQQTSPITATACRFETPNITGYYGTVAWTGVGGGSPPQIKQISCEYLNNATFTVGAGVSLSDDLGRSPFVPSTVTRGTGSVATAFATKIGVAETYQDSDIILSDTQGGGHQFKLRADSGTLAAKSSGGTQLFAFDQTGSLIQNGQWVYPDSTGTYRTKSSAPSSSADGAVVNREYKSVKEFGAKGDGTTDDGAAIQAAFTWAQNIAKAGKGASLYFPAGTYLSSIPLVFDASGGSLGVVRIFGEAGGISGNSAGVYIKYTGTVGSTVSNAGGAVRASNVVTVTTTAPHGYSVGQTVVWASVNDGINFVAGAKVIASVPTSTTFTYAETGSNASSSIAVNWGPVFMTFTGLRGSSLERLEIDGGRKAAYTLWLKNTNVGLDIHNVSAENPALNGDSACVAIGVPSLGATAQNSEFWFEKCSVGGWDGGTNFAGYGYKWLIGGNTKNFWFNGGYINGCGVGVGYVGEGLLDISNVCFLNINDRCISPAVGTIRVANCEIEASTPASRFIDGNLGTLTRGSLILDNCSWSGIAPSDDGVIRYSGALTITGGEYANGRTTTSVPVIIIDGAILDGPAGAISSLFMRGVTIYNATDLNFIRDTSNNFICGGNASSGNYGIQKHHAVDVAGLISHTSSGEVHLPQVVGATQQVASGQLAWPTLDIGAPAASVVVNGDPRGGFWAAFQVDYRAWAVAATTFSPHLCQPAGLTGMRTRIKEVIADVTTPFTGSAGTVTLSVGRQTTTTDAYLLAKDVKTAATTIGLTSADFGTALASGGVLTAGDWYWTTQANDAINATLVSGTGNLNTLTAGVVTFWVHYDRIS